MELSKFCARSCKTLENLCHDFVGSCDSCDVCGFASAPTKHEQKLRHKKWWSAILLLACSRNPNDARAIHNRNIIVINEIVISVRLGCDDLVIHGTLFLPSPRCRNRTSHISCILSSPTSCIHSFVFYSHFNSCSTLIFQIADWIGLE